MGNPDTEHYYDKADQQLAHLLKDMQAVMGDYSMALALIAFAFAALAVKVDKAKSSAYVDTAIEICKNVGELNSDAYMRCLNLLTCHPARYLYSCVCRLCC